MSWSFCVGIVTSVISLGAVTAIWNQASRDYAKLKFYKTRYALRDQQLVSTLTEWVKLNKSYTMLLDTCSELLSENIAQSEKIGELEIEISLANGRVQPMTELYLQEQRRADSLQAELDEIFKPENFV